MSDSETKKTMESYFVEKKKDPEVLRKMIRTRIQKSLTDSPKIVEAVTDISATTVDIKKIKLTNILVDLFAPSLEFRAEYCMHSSSELLPLFDKVWAGWLSNLYLSPELIEHPHSARTVNTLKQAAFDQADHILEYALFDFFPGAPRDVLEYVNDGGSPRLQFRDTGSTELHNFRRRKGQDGEYQCKPKWEIDVLGVLCDEKRHKKTFNDKYGDLTAALKAVAQADGTKIVAVKDQFRSGNYRLEVSKDVYNEWSKAIKRDEKTYSEFKGAFVGNYFFRFHVNAKAEEEVLQDQKSEILSQSEESEDESQKSTVEKPVVSDQKSEDLPQSDESTNDEGQKLPVEKPVASDQESENLSQSDESKDESQQPKKPVVSDQKSEILPQSDESTDESQEPTVGKLVVSDQESGNLPQSDESTNEESLPPSQQESGEPKQVANEKAPLKPSPKTPNVKPVCLGQEVTSCCVSTVIVVTVVFGALVLALFAWFACLSKKVASDEDDDQWEDQSDDQWAENRCKDSWDEVEEDDEDPTSYSHW